jgi:ketosteroid isomerase-like protein
VPPAESQLLRTFRQAFEEANRAWNAGDMKRAYVALPDQLEYRLSPIWPEARVLRSRDEVIAFFENFQATFPDARTTPHEYIEADEGTVIVGSHVTGTGRTSGAGAEMEIWQIWRVRTPDDGPIVLSVTEFSDRQEAIEAGGISEASARGAQ